MAEVDGFLESTMPLLTEAETALHNGDAGLRTTIWSHTDPVTFFGAAVTKSGWDEIGLTLVGTAILELRVLEVRGHRVATASRCTCVRTSRLKAILAPIVRGPEASVSEGKRLLYL